MVLRMGPIVRIESVMPVMTRSLLAALPRAMPDVGRLEAEAPAQSAPPPGAAGAAPQPSVQMLVALAAGSGIERRRKLAEPADKGLKLLERLHGQLSAGAVDATTLADAAEWVESLETPADPALAALQRDVEVRVRVELAKLDMAV